MLGARGEAAERVGLVAIRRQMVIRGEIVRGAVVGQVVEVDVVAAINGHGV